MFAAVLLLAATLKVSAQSEESRQVSGFHGIASAGPFDVHVKIDGTESLKISASSDIMGEIETKVEDGKLEIKLKHHDWGRNHIGRIDIYVTAKSLSSLANAGSGSIKVDGVISGENVTINLSGSGSIFSAVKSGNFHASISGSGSMHLSGSASETKLSIAGSGEMNAKEFKTGSASVAIAGSGSAYFAAEKEISASIVGSGNVVYTGSATISSNKTIGSGRVSKAD